MSIRKIIAATMSVAISCSMIAVFHSSSQSYVSYLQQNRLVASANTIPVRELAPVTVYATAPARDTVNGLGVSAKPVQTGFSLPLLGNGVLHQGSRLYMPYYSFASKLRTVIKD